MKLDAVLTKSEGVEVFLDAGDLELLEAATLNHPGAEELYQQVAWARRGLARSIGLAKMQLADHTEEGRRG